MNPTMLDLLKTSLESSAPPENVEINPVTDNTEKELDLALAEVAQAESAVETAGAVETTLTNAADGVDEAVGEMEAVKEEKGEISLEAYRPLQLAIKNAVRGLPFDFSPMTVSHESFTLLNAETVSAEAMDKAKELLSKLWQAVKDALTRVWEALKGWFEKLGKSGEALIASGNDLKKRAAAARGKKAKEGDLTGVGKDLNSIQFDGSVPAAGEIAGLLRKAVTNGRTGGAIILEMSATYATQMAEAARIGVASATTISFDEEFVKSTRAFESTIKKLDGLEGPGGNIVKVNDTSDGKGIGTSMKVVNTIAGEAKIKPATPEEVAAIGTALVELGGFLQEFDKKYFKAFDAKLSADLAKARAMVSKDAVDATATKVYLKLIQWTSGQIKHPMPNYVGLVATAGKAAYSIASKSLKMYGGEAAPLAIAGPTT